MFGVTAQDGLARCGNLITRHAAVATPTAMLYTRRGGSMYLTPDMLAKLRPEAQLLQVNVMQL
jgi:queuine/archaeosine tRNA-ribosyltransferase